MSKTVLTLLVAAKNLSKPATTTATEPKTTQTMSQSLSYNYRIGWLQSSFDSLSIKLIETT